MNGLLLGRVGSPHATEVHVVSWRHMSHSILLASPKVLQHVFRCQKSSSNWKDVNNNVLQQLQCPMEDKATMKAIHDTLEQHCVPTVINIYNAVQQHSQPSQTALQHLALSCFMSCNDCRSQQRKRLP